MGADYPSHAIEVRYQSYHSSPHTYRLWDDNGLWKWYALGNAGVELTQSAAMEAARRWLRDRLKGRDRAHVGR